jgi:hypothetical protein
LHFSESNGILFVIFRVTKLKIRILQVYTFFCYFCQFRKSENIPENIPLTSGLTSQRSNRGSTGDLGRSWDPTVQEDLAILTAVRTRRAMAVQTTAVAAAPTVPRPGGGGGEVRRAAATPLAVSSAAPTLPSRSDVLLPSTTARSDSGELLAAGVFRVSKGKR